MIRILIVCLCCSLLLLSSCADAGVPVCPDLPDSFASETTETSVPDEAYAIVDWMIFVRYNGRSYTRDFAPPTVIPAERIGEQLGTVTGKPPSPTPVDYVTNVPDFTSFGYPIGSPFYAVEGMRPEYAIAVYDAQEAEYHLLCYEHWLPNESKIVRGGWLSGEFMAPAVRLVESYDDFPVRHREQFPEYDAAFFEDNVLAVLYLEEGSGSISHEVTKIRRAGETIEIHIRREIPEVGTCDMAYWTVVAAISREDWDGAEVVTVINTVQAWNE